MQTQDYDNKQVIFVELRARGRSLHRIGEILGVPPATMAAWETPCAHAIADTKASLAREENDDEDQLDPALAGPRERLRSERSALRAWLEFEYRFRMVEIVALCLVRANRAQTESHTQALSMLEPGSNRRKLRAMSPADFAQRLAQLTESILESRKTSPAPATPRNRTSPSIANN